MNDQFQDEQRAFLHAVKQEAGLPWDALADAAGIAPRALKTYRMPVGSSNRRPLPSLAREALQRLVTERQNRKK